MTFEEAIDRAIKKYWEDKKKAPKDSPLGFKYNKKYFDRFEEQEFGSKIDWLNQGEPR